MTKTILLWYKSYIHSDGLRSFDVKSNKCFLKTRFSYAFPKEFPYRMNHVLECEFYLLELMDCCLIVYHPYRPLLQYVQDMGQEDMLLPLAWRVVNDTYRTDLCLLYPPFMIALACLHVACVVQQKDARQWFAELSVDMEKILEIIRVILKLYDQWKNFDDRKEMAAVLNKMPKPKPPPNRVRERRRSAAEDTDPAAGTGQPPGEMAPIPFFLASRIATTPLHA
ncbi:unnamed protein product [Oncorhynchus mykiss]|uniref:Cyclin-like domain-containing protein n=1 Tax=Oncorhynchus mykiss TaxID=8022 RepID=A0A060YIU6_ONCMY|nr:unnamed protein product [Oncorhynchus mykiss]